MALSDRIISNEYRTSIFAVHEYDETHIEGELYNRYWNGSKDIRCLRDLICKIDSLMEELSCPMESMAKRSFAQAEAEESIAMKQINTGSVPHGKKATFSIQIQYRNNATWQGTVIWMETGTREFFRSALELFWLIDSAMLRD